MSIIIKLKNGKLINETIHREHKYTLHEIRYKDKNDFMIAFPTDLTVCISYLCEWV